MICTLFIWFRRFYKFGGNMTYMWDKVFYDLKNDTKVFKINVFQDNKLLALTNYNLYILNKYDENLLCKVKNENKSHNLEIISKYEFIAYNDNSLILYHYEENSDFDLINCYKIFSYNIPFNIGKINNLYYRKKNIICFADNILVLKILKNYNIEIQTKIKSDFKYTKNSFKGFLLNNQTAIIIRKNSNLIEFWDINNKYKLISIIKNINIDFKIDSPFYNLKNNDEFLIFNYRTIWKFSFINRSLISEHTFNYLMYELIITNNAIYGIGEDDNYISYFYKYNFGENKFIKIAVLGHYYNNFIIENDENIICTRTNNDGIIYYLINTNTLNILSEILMLIIHFFICSLYFKYFYCKYFSNIELTRTKYALIFLFNPFILQYINFGKINLEVIRKEGVGEFLRLVFYIILWLIYWGIHFKINFALTLGLFHLKFRYFNPFYKPRYENPESVPFLSNR